jgi:hypothetical protein
MSMALHSHTREGIIPTPLSGLLGRNLLAHQLLGCLPCGTWSQWTFGEKIYAAFARTDVYPERPRPDGVTVRSSV